MTTTVRMVGSARASMVDAAAERNDAKLMKTSAVGTRAAAAATVPTMGMATSRLPKKHFWKPPVAPECLCGGGGRVLVGQFHLFFFFSRVFLYLSLLHTWRHHDRDGRRVAPWCERKKRVVGNILLIFAAGWRQRVCVSVEVDRGAKGKNGPSKGAVFFLLAPAVHPLCTLRGQRHPALGRGGAWERGRVAQRASKNHARGRPHLGRALRRPASEQTPTFPLPVAKLQV